jgi:hypothetical protein
VPDEAAATDGSVFTGEAGLTVDVSVADLPAESVVDVDGFAS